MKILAVCDVFGPNCNGTMVAQNNFIASMRKRGHQVKILCADQSYKGQPDMYICPNLKLGLLDDYVKKEGVTLGYPKKGIIASSMEGIDVVHIFQPLFLGVRACKIAYDRGLAITAGFHTQAENVSVQIKMMNNEFVNSSLYKYFWSSLYRYCNCIHYPTQFVRNIFERSMGLKTNGYVISNGVLPVFKKNMNAIRPKEWEGKYIIVFTGRLSGEKNQTLLMNAVKLSKHQDRIQLVLAGDGPLKEKLVAMGASFINKPYISFFSRPDLIDLLSIADLYVHPALVDLESISCLEAISCGVLPLLSNSPKTAVGEYSRDPHCLFQYDSAQNLADHIDWFIEHPKESEEIKRLYANFQDNYDYEKCMDRMEAMLRDAIDMNARGVKKPVDYSKEELEAIRLKD